jgi:hypothetical protein
LARPAAMGSSACDTTRQKDDVVLLRDWDSRPGCEICDGGMAWESVETFTWEDAERGSLVKVDVDAFFWGTDWGW